MISNCSIDGFDIIEVTNELPLNRLGGVGSVIDSLLSGFQSLGSKVLWYLTDHNYSPAEIDLILAEFPNLAIGSPEELTSIKAPIVHIHTYNHNPRMVEYLENKRSVFTIHSLLRCEADSNDVDMSWTIARQEALIAGCDEVVLVSQAELGHYQRLGYDKLNKQVSVIHNGLKNPRKYYHGGASRRLGFCGRMVPRKRPEYVQMILKEKGFESYSSLIAGRGFSSYTRNLMQDDDLRNRVHYLGWCGQERLEAFYQAIELLVIPSAYEPFGMVALEAMARGVPVACTRIDGLVEILGEEAIYAEDYRYDSFRDAMWQWLRTDKIKRASMVKSARERYYRHFTDTAMAGNYLSLFGQIA